MKESREFTAEFKARVVLAILSNEKTVAQVCAEERLSESLVHRWIGQFVEGAPKAFRESNTDTDTGPAVDELESKVARLKSELEIVRKICEYLGVPR